MGRSSYNAFDYNRVAAGRFIPRFSDCIGTNPKNTVLKTSLRSLCFFHSRNSCRAPDSCRVFPAAFRA